MQEYEQNDRTHTGPVTGEIPTIVKIKPGSAAEKSLKFKLPESLQGGSIEQIVRYGLGLSEEDGLTRNALRIQENVVKEMKDKYGMTVNGNGVKTNESIEKYAGNYQTSGTGTRYAEIEIIVAARQEGANGLEHLMRR